MPETARRWAAGHLDDFPWVGGPRLILKSFDRVKSGFYEGLVHTRSL
jgi:hypothetical protein